MRLPVINSIAILPKIAMFLVPLMAQFAIPIASALSIGTVIGNFFLEDEILLFYYFYSARKVLHKSVLIFSLSLLALYIPIVFVWAPQSYRIGKEFIVSLAQKQFHQLEPNKFHDMFSRFCIYFQEKENLNKKLVLKKIFLNLQEKDGSRYIVNAQKGFFVKDYLLLQDGVIQNLNSNKFYAAQFKETKINIKQFLDDSVKNVAPVQLKFMSLAQLKNLKDNKSEANIEYHKRMIQVLWQLLFPFFALFGMMIFARKKSNLLVNIFISGFIFLFSYVCTSVAQAWHSYFIISMSLLYFPVLFIAFVLFFFYRKKF